MTENNNKILKIYWNWFFMKTQGKIDYNWLIETKKIFKYNLCTYENI